MVASNFSKAILFLQQHQHWRNHAQSSRFCRKNHSDGNFSIEQFEFFSLPETTHDAQTIFLSVCGLYNTYVRCITVRLTRWWLQIFPKAILFLQQHQHWRNLAQTSRFCRKNYSEGNFSIEQFEFLSLHETTHDAQTIFLSVCGLYNTYVRCITVRLTRWCLQIPQMALFVYNNTNIWEITNKTSIFCPRHYSKKKFFNSVV